MPSVLPTKGQKIHLFNWGIVSLLGSYIFFIYDFLVKDIMFSISNPVTKLHNIFTTAAEGRAGIRPES